MNFLAHYKKFVSKAPLLLLSETIIYLFLSPLILTSAPIHNLIFFSILTLFNILFIRLLFNIKKLKKRRNLIYCLLYFFAAFLVLYTVNYNIGGMSFLDWILSGAGFDFMYMPFIMVVSVVSIIFVSTTIFYFSEIYFRGIILIFLMYIPLCYNYVLVKELTLFEIFCLCVSLCFIIMQGLRYNISTLSIKKSSAFYRLGAFIAIFSALVTLIMPKDIKTPYSQVLDNIMAYNPFESKGINQLGSLNDFSGASNYRNINSSRLLYTVEASENLYLKKTSFINYDYKQWVIPIDSSAKTLNIKQYVHNTNIAEFYNFLRDIYPDKKEIFDKYNIKYEDIPKTSIQKRTAKIKAEKFRANFAISPLKNIETNVNGSSLAQNLLGASYLPYIDNNMEYTVSYYSDDLKFQPEVMDFSNKFNLDRYENFISEITEDKHKAYPAVYDHIFEMAQSELYRKNMTYESPKIKALAEEITKGLTGDYDKAVALENYFRNNDYVYSLDYVPEDDSIEYFIFNSKTGSCGQYATAMTLMAESIGLSARYTEGFVTTPVLDEKNKYTITGNDAHAYVEVFIPGYGFSVFDPTVSSNSEDSTAANNNTGLAKLGLVIKNYVSIATILGVIALILLYLIIHFLKPRIKDLLFIKRLKKADKKASLTYKYIRELLMKKNKAELLALTPKETACFVKEKYNIDIEPLISDFEAEQYANKESSIKDTATVKDLINKIRKIK